MKKKNKKQDGEYHNGMSCYCGTQKKYEKWQVVYNDIIECTACGKIWVVKDQLELDKIKRPEVTSFGPEIPSPSSEEKNINILR